jgi:hypothetical protein
MNIITYWSEVNQVFNPSLITRHPLLVTVVTRHTKTSGEIVCDLKLS